MRSTGAGSRPTLFLNVFPPSFNGLYVMGMIEASGIGWQGRYEQAELIAEYLSARAATVPMRAEAFRRRVADEPWPDLTGGYKYLGLERMSYYVNKDAYRRAVRAARDFLRTEPQAPAAAPRQAQGPGRSIPPADLEEEDPRMNIDDVVLNFTPGTLIILNVVLGLIMFGIALDTSPEDFKVVARKPKPFVIAILAQLIVLPAVTFALTLILPVTPSMALGMILVACCPPGNISQVLTHRSGGNVALSVSMTAVSNLIYIFVLPLSRRVLGFAAPDRAHPAHCRRAEPVDDAAGHLPHHRRAVPGGAGHPRRSSPSSQAKVQPFVKWFSLLALVGFIVAALAGNWAYFIAFLGVILVVVAIHDAVALAIGYGTPSWAASAPASARR